jgi:hypothetical protein
MKITFSLRYYSLFLMIIPLWLPLSLCPISQTELDQLINNQDQCYIYCDKDHSKLAEVIAEIGKFDENKSSPIWQLHAHIQKGFSIGRQDAVIEVLDYAAQTLEKNYHYLTNDKIEHIQTILTSVIDAVANGKLTVSLQSLSVPTKSMMLDHNNYDVPRATVVKVSRPIRFLNHAKFKKHAKFEDDVTFENDVTFKDDVTFQDKATFETNVFIQGSLLTSDETIDCDLTVGCNINMNDSSSLDMGNILKAGIPFIHNFGIQNTYIGSQSGNFTMTGQGNTACGSFTLSANQNGFYNVASGLGALYSNQSGSINTAIGSVTLVNNISGEANTAVGFFAMAENVSGSGNTAIGVESLYNNNSGDDNTAIGAGALDSSSTGSGNVALGVNAGTTLVTGNDNIYIAANASTSSESGNIRIGTNGTHTATFIQGIANSAVVGSAVVVDTLSGQLGVVVSSRKFKHNIADMSSDSANIYNLHPVTFAYNNDVSETKQYGLIAEEVAQVFPEIVVYDADGAPHTVQYQVLPVLLLNEVQKQQIHIEQQQISLEQHQASINAILERVSHLEEHA